MIPATPLKTKRQLQKGLQSTQFQSLSMAANQLIPVRLSDSVWCEIGTAHCRMTLIIVLILLSLYIPNPQTKLIWIVGS